MPVQSGEITNILLLLQGQHQCVLVALAKTVSQFTHNCNHIHPAPSHRVSYLHSLVLPCEAGTNFTYSYSHYEAVLVRSTPVTLLRLTLSRWQPHTDGHVFYLTR